jgi:hypothetical protein
MSKEQLLREFAAAYERVIATAADLAQRGVSRRGDDWGPREVVAHLAGWEVMATVRVPHIAAGMAPLEFEDSARQAVVTDAINATIVAMAGDQSLDTLSAILRRAYWRDVEQLTTLGDQHFQPGQYVYERTRNAIWHCEEHIDKLTSR